jgi:hypothetical protein
MNQPPAPSSPFGRLPSEAAIERIVSASVNRMADFASHITPNETYTEADIVAAITADPTGEAAHFLAGVIVKSIELVSVLDAAEQSA